MEFKQQKVINDKADVDFLVNTGKRHRLVEITIQGNHYFSTDVIRERMYLQKANLLQFPHGRYSENLVRRDRDNITNLYESNGFRDVKVTLSLDRRFPRQGGRYRRDARDSRKGRSILVNSIQVDGMEKLDKARLLAKLSSAEGQPFSEFNVAVDRDTILAEYFENGFPARDLRMEFQARRATPPRGPAFRGARGRAAVRAPGADQPAA